MRELIFPHVVVLDFNNVLEMKKSDQDKSHNDWKMTCKNELKEIILRLAE